MHPSFITKYLISPKYHQQQQQIHEPQVNFKHVIPAIFFLIHPREQNV